MRNISYICGMKQNVFFRLFTTFSVWLCACSQSGTDPRLTEISDIIENDRAPREALRQLEIIDKAGLNEADRHYYDLLTVKAHDKAYDRHQSDSLIMDAVEWYDGHRSDPGYAEALYYAGRVNSDLGDLPRALTYYEAALDLVPEGCGRNELRGRVLSQTARIMVRLRLYKEAIGYLEESLKLCSELNDTLNLPYAHMILGTTYKRISDFGNADKHLTAATILSKGLKESDYFGMKGELAILKYQEGKTDSALNLIRGVVNKMKTDDDRDYFRANALKIYSKAGIADTALMYARQAIGSDNLSYQISGYAALLSPELIGYLPADSVVDYARAYSRAVSASRDKNAEEAAIAQNALYNYSRYRLASERLDGENSSLWMRLYIAVTLIVALVAAVWYVGRLYSRKKAAYDSRESSIDMLRSSMTALEREIERYRTDPDIIRITGKGTERSSQITAAIEKLSRQLAETGQKINDGAFTEGYRLIREAVADGRVIRDARDIWTKVSESVEAISPGFRDRLTDMSGGRLTDDDYRLACMIRLGISSADTARVLGYRKGTITNRRHLLCDRLFGPGSDLSHLDSVISRM